MNLSREEKIWATLCHLAGLVFFIPGFNLLAPLLIWLIKKEESRYIDYHGKEALNFQLSILLYALISSLLLLIIVGLPLMLVLGVLDIIFIIVASVNAFDAKLYQYPLSIRFIK